MTRSWHKSPRRAWQEVQVQKQYYGNKGYSSDLFLCHGELHGSQWSGHQSWRGEDLFIQTDQSAAGFNIDQFHLVMPVVVENGRFRSCLYKFLWEAQRSRESFVLWECHLLQSGSCHGKSPFLKYDIKNVAEIYVWNNAVYMIIEPGVLFVLWKLGSGMSIIKQEPFSKRILIGYKMS